MWVRQSNYRGFVGHFGVDRLVTLKQISVTTQVTNTKKSGIGF